MEDGSHDRGCRKRLRTDRSKRLLLQRALCPGDARKQVPSMASSGVRAADPSSPGGEVMDST